MRQVIIHEADEDETGYWAECPSLPGCVSQGETIEETLANIREAIDLYIESLEARGLPVPEDSYSKEDILMGIREGMRDALTGNTRPAREFLDELDLF